MSKNVTATNEKEYKFTMKKACTHFKTIVIHKHYVLKYMIKCGHPFQGFIHDFSKFSPTEFFTNVKYVEKGISPIDIQKREFGYSTAWQHHKGHNPHHYEYWTDKYDNGGYIHRMPLKYLVESICDTIAANLAYNGKYTTYEQLLEYWNKKKEITSMHPDDVSFTDTVLNLLYLLEREDVVDTIDYCNNNCKYNIQYEEDIFNKDFLASLHREIIKENNIDSCIKLRQQGAVDAAK